MNQNEIYVGARYVPVFADDPWSSDREYEPLTVVLHEGNSYTSRQFVPEGIDINNGLFWARTGDYNAQVDLYREETRLKAFAFDTVTDMQDCTVLFNGAICHTNGFHSVGDGGAAWYVISNSTEVETLGTDVIGIPSNENPMLYANLSVIDDCVNNMMVGINPSTSVDKSTDLNRLLDYCYESGKNAHILPGQYLIANSLRVRVNTICDGELIGDEIDNPFDASSNLRGYAAVQIQGDKITFKNAKISPVTPISDNDTGRYNGPSSEANSATRWGGINVSIDSSNVTIENCDIDVCQFGIRYYSSKGKNCTIRNCKIAAGIGLQFEIPDASDTSTIEKFAHILINSCNITANGGLRCGQNKSLKVSDCSFVSYDKRRIPFIYLGRNDAQTSNVDVNAMFSNCYIEDNTTLSHSNHTITLYPETSVHENAPLSVIKLDMNNCILKITDSNRINATRLISSCDSIVSLTNCHLEGAILFNDSYADLSGFGSLACINCNFYYPYRRAVAFISQKTITDKYRFTLIGNNFKSIEISTIYAISVNMIYAVNNYFADDYPALNLNAGVSKIISKNNYCKRAMVQFSGNANYNSYIDENDFNTSTNSRYARESNRQYPATPVGNLSYLNEYIAGDLVFDTTNKVLMVFDGTNWVNV